MADEIPGDVTRPRYYHLGLNLVEHISGTTIRHRDCAKAKLKRRVKAQGGDVEDVEYRAGMGLGLINRRRQR